MLRVRCGSGVDETDQVRSVSMMRPKSNDTVCDTVIRLHSRRCPVCLPRVVTSVNQSQRGLLCLFVCIQPRRGRQERDLRPCVGKGRVLVESLDLRRGYEAPFRVTPDRLPLSKD